MNNVGIVIVTHNSGEVIGRCLRSCPAVPICVVDNSSDDDTVEVVRAHKPASLIENQRNLGFAVAVNQGVRVLGSELVLVLNPDVELRDDLQPLLDGARLSGLSGGRLLDVNGQTQVGFCMRQFPTVTTLIFEVLGWNRLWPGNPINRQYRCLDKNWEQPQTIEQPPGALLCFRRDVWQALGGFDEEFYPVWFEDVDFCKRASELGFRAAYVPEVQAGHLGGHSIAHLQWGDREQFWYASLLRYATKHFHPWKYRGLSAIVVVSSGLRAAYAAFKQKSLKPFKVYARIAWRALRGAFALRVMENRRPALSKAVG